MNKTLPWTAATLAASISFSGCMATQPAHYGSTAGALSSVPSVSQEEQLSTPQFSDEQLTTRYSALLDRYREFEQSPESYLSSDDAASACDLSNAGKWLATHGKPEDEMKSIHTRQNRQLKVSNDTTINSVSLLEGDCVNGIPEGEFVSVGQIRQVTRWEGATPTVTLTSVRIEGNARQGKMDGTFDSFSRSVSDFRTGTGAAQQSTNLSAMSTETERGQDIGTQLMIMGQSGVITTMIRNSSQTPLGRHDEVTTYQGSRLISTVNQLNNEAHGWLTNHLMPAGQKQTCMFQGELADDSACAGMAVASVAIKPVANDLLEQLVRTDNLGQFMSPYTSDGVLAEWVNMGSNASIGGTAGSGVGAVAGSMIADKALESVPFGSLLGGFLGSAVGEEVGREAGISASGGWETIRSSSDRSFNSLTDMARYLAQKYGNEPTYGDAIKVTMQVYPEFQNAMASAY